MLESLKAYVYPKVWLLEASGDEVSWVLVSLTRENSGKSVPPLRLTCPLAMLNCGDIPDRELVNWDRKFCSKAAIWNVCASVFLGGVTWSRKSSVGETEEGLVSSPEKEKECWESTKRLKLGLSKVDLKGEFMLGLNLDGDANCFSVENKGWPARLLLSFTNVRLWLFRYVSFWLVLSSACCRNLEYSCKRLAFSVGGACEPVPKDSAGLLSSEELIEMLDVTSASATLKVISACPLALFE